MDLATCTLNRQTYTSIDFSRLPPQEIERLRHHLICVVCLQTAFFRKKSTDGKKACFGSTEHLSSCTEYLSSKNPSKHEAVTEKVNMIIASNEIVNLDFSIKAETQYPSEESHSDQPQAISTVKKEHVIDPATRKVSRLKLSKALEYLMYSPGFSQSDILVNTGAPHPFKAKNLFVNFHQIEPEKLSEMNGRTWKGYWGLIESCSKDWLRSGNVVVPLSKLDQGLLNGIMQKENIKRYNEFIGRYILIFGKLAKGKETLYVKVDENTDYVINRQ